MLAPRAPLNLLARHKEKGFAKRYLLRLSRDQRGAGVIEYVLVASLISGIAAIDEVGRSVDNNLSDVNSKL